MKTKLLQALVLLVVAASASAVRADSLLDDLSPDQLSQMKSGQMVVRPTDVDGAPWPRLQVYVKVNAPVQAVEDVFRDYSGASSYIPNLVSADVLSHPNPNTYDVRYTSTMPLVGKVSNTVRNKYSYDGNALVVNWNLLQSGLADESTGQLRVEPYGSGSVLRYTNFVRPKSSFAFLAKGAALSEVKATVAAIKKEAERRFDAGLVKGTGGGSPGQQKTPTP